MKIRKTQPGDIPEIDEIYRNAKIFMRESGNPLQWRGDYPNGEDARCDMENGIGYVCEDEGEIVAVFAFCVDREVSYDKIYEGKWLNDSEYAYIHRIAVKKRGSGIADFCFNECFKIHPNIKIDTHKDNLPMQKVLARNGFVHCGTVYIENGEERIAYQKN